MILRLEFRDNNSEHIAAIINTFKAHATFRTWESGGVVWYAVELGPREIAAHRKAIRMVESWRSSRLFLQHKPYYHPDRHGIARQFYTFSEYLDAIVGISRERGVWLSLGDAEGEPTDNHIINRIREADTPQDLLKDDEDDEAANE